MILVIIAVLMAVTNTLTRTELDITVTMREQNKIIINHFSAGDHTVKLCKSR